MVASVTRHLRRNLVAHLALLFALGGTAAAASAGGVGGLHPAARNSRDGVTRQAGRDGPQRKTRAVRADLRGRCVICEAYALDVRAVEV
jgi:hypothetical protein